MKRFIRPDKGLSSFLLLWGTQSCSAFGSSMTSFALTVWSYQQHGSALSTALLAVCSYAPYVLLSLFAGGLFMTSIFMATDYVTSPITDWGKVIFGVGCGFFTAAIRVFANAAEGVTFAILLMNLLVPYINGWTRKKAFGGNYIK